MNIASDLEGTLTTGATWKGMVSYMRAHGRGRACNAYLATHTPQILLFRAGLLNSQHFKSRWIEDLLGFFQGATPDEFAPVADWVMEQALWPNRRADVIAELARHQQAGQRVILTSASFTPIVERFAARIGVSEVLATQIEVSDGRLTGRVDGPYNRGLAKAESLRAYLGGDGLDAAYGDTMADGPMLEMSRAPVAVYPEEKLAQVAHQRGWRVLGES